jgi:hypothetical protein
MSSSISSSIHSVSFWYSMSQAEYRQTTHTQGPKRGGIQLKFAAVDQELFNQVMEQLISALDKLTPTIEVARKN